MKSAKEFRSILKGQGLDDDTCDSMVQKGIESGGLFDDLKAVDKGQGDAKTASALLQSLNDVMDPTDAVEAVQKAIAKGGVVDDIGLGDALDVEELDAIIAKGGEFGGGGLFDDFDDVADFGLDDFGDNFDGPTEFEREIAKSIQGIPRDVAAVAKSQRGLQATVAAQAATIASLTGQLTEAVEAVKEIQKGLGGQWSFTTPLSGAQPVASPMDGPGGIADPSQKGAADDDTVAREKLGVEIEKAIAKGSPAAAMALTDILNDLVEGAPTQAVRDAYEAAVMSASVAQ